MWWELWACEGCGGRSMSVPLQVRTAPAELGEAGTKPSKVLGAAEVLCVRAIVRCFVVHNYFYFLRANSAMPWCGRVGSSQAPFSLTRPVL